MTIFWAGQTVSNWAEIHMVGSDIQGSCLKFSMCWPIAQHDKLSPLRLGEAVGNNIREPHTKFPKSYLWAWKFQMGLGKIGELSTTVRFII